jgi:hypothetical protein
MEHRGMPFALVRTLAPNGWRWAVQLDDKQRSGEHVDRNVAIQQAKAVIDRLIERRRASGSSQTHAVQERGLTPKPAGDEA